jgi:hypothetical protein
MQFRSVLIILCLLIASIPAQAAKHSSGDPNVSFGPAITGGYTSIWQRTGDNQWDWGYCYGAGFIVEKMFTNRLGIHSGLWYLNSTTNMKPGKDAPDSWAIMHSLTMPLYLIVAATKGAFTFNFLAGLDVGVIVDCTIHTNSDSFPNKTGEVKKYLSPYQFGLALGMNFKFRVAKYVDLFFGFIGDFYVTSLERKHEGRDSYGHIYDGRAMMGVLFRTNIFPMASK